MKRAGMRVGRLAAVGAIGASTALSIAGPRQTTLIPDRDNTLIDDGTGDRSNGAGEYLLSGLTGAFSRRRALLRFDVAAALPADSRVVDVALTLHVSRSQTGHAPMTIHRVLADWGEGTSDAGERPGIGAPATPGDATWLHRFYPGAFWAQAGGDFDLVASDTRLIGGLGFWTWSSTPALIADVQFWSDHAALNFGWCIVGDETEPSAKRFDSRENINAAVRPRLVVTFDPCIGDVNNDDAIDFVDALLVFDHLGDSGPPYPIGDLNYNQVVDMGDVADLQVRFGGACPR